MNRLPNTVVKKCKGCGCTLYFPYPYQARTIWCEDCTEEDELEDLTVRFLTLQEIARRNRDNVTKRDVQIKEKFKLLQEVQTVLYDKFNVPPLDTGGMNQAIEHALDYIKEYKWKRR